MTVFESIRWLNIINFFFPPFPSKRFWGWSGQRLFYVKNPFTDVDMAQEACEEGEGLPWVWGLTCVGPCSHSTATQHLTHFHSSSTPLLASAHSSGLARSAEAIFPPGCRSLPLSFHSPFSFFQHQIHSPFFLFFLL